MNKGPDFIGIGAQRCATSWIYANLYEHPELCLPFKEIHFFSRSRYEEKGIEWYKNRWSTCSDNQLKGEYSTSYLYSNVAAKRIKKHVPDAKLIVCLRNPVERAYSNYRLDQKTGEASQDVSFEEALEGHPKYSEQGFYAEQLQRYFDCFSREQMHVMMYEDIQKNPQVFMQAVYRFLGVDDAFVSSMLNERINVGQSERIWVVRTLHAVANVLRALRLHKLVWWGKKTGVPSALRSAGTANMQEGIKPETRQHLQETFRDDVRKLSEMLNRDLLSEWNFE